MGSINSGFAELAAALAAAAGGTWSKIVDLFSGGMLNGRSWGFRGGTPRKRSRFGSVKRSNEPGSSSKKHRGKFCKARAGSHMFGNLASRPSYKHPHALCAKPMPSLMSEYSAARDPRVRSIMRNSGNDVADVALAIRQFAARPYPARAEARGMFAGTRGNMGPGFGKKQRKLIARGSRPGASRLDRAKMLSARKLLATRGGP